MREIPSKTVPLSKQQELTSSEVLLPYVPETLDTIPIPILIRKNKDRDRDGV